MNARYSVVRRHLVGAALAILAGPSPVAGQFAFQAKQGTTWGDNLVLSQLAPMTFRWRWDGRGNLHAALWQMTFQDPSSRPAPAIVQSGGVRVPQATRLSDYATFQIPANAVPAGAPGTFYVRMLSGTRYSAWIPVTITGQRRASTSIALPPVMPSGVTSPPLMTAGVPNPNPPLWMKLTKLICNVESADGSASDEVYAIVASVAIDWSRPWASTVHVAHSKIMEDVDDGDIRVLNLPVWGPPDGSATPLSKPHDAVILVALMEQDRGSPFLTATLTKARLLQVAGTLNPEQSYGKMASLLLVHLRERLRRRPAHKRHVTIGSARQLPLG
jgi:hypothetical protein